MTGDGSDLDKGKSDIIKKQQEDVEQKAKDRTKALLSEYADYLGKKITFEDNYVENSRLLNEQLAKMCIRDRNNTVVAPPRMLIAFLENNLQADGSVRIPEVLRPYMGGISEIKPK